jgi:hypothetical protein
LRQLCFLVAASTLWDAWNLQADLDQLKAPSAKDRAALHKHVVLVLNVQILQPLLSFLP